MKCAICGRETAEKFHINGRCVCEECYSFFITETGVSKSMTFLNMQVSDYVRNLQEMEDAELRNSLVTALRKHAGKCSVRIPSALLDEASDAVLNGSVGQLVTSTENSVQDDGADEEADEEVILNRDVALLTTDTYPGRKIVKVFGIDGVNIGLRAAVKVVDVGRHGFAVFVHAADAADNAVTHDRSDVRRTVAFALDGINGFLHALDGDVEKLVNVHLHPARLRIVQRGGKRVRRDRIKIFVVDGNLDRLRARIKSHVKLCHIQSSCESLAGNFSRMHFTQVC